MNVEIIVTSNNQENFSVNCLTKYAQGWNFNVSPACYEEKTSDIDKIENITHAFNSNSQVILAMRGGSGATRLMSTIKQLELNDTRKILVGYSDLTVLLNYPKIAETMTCIHGPMAFELTTKERINKFISAVKKCNVQFNKRATWYRKQPLAGKVIGGNLLVLTDMLGTFYEPDFKDKILLIEEIDEPVDKIDRMFAQLRDSGKLQQLSGLILGQFTKCDDETKIMEVLDYYLKDLKIGVLIDVNLGHVKDADYIHLNTNLIIDEAGIYYQ